MASAKEQHCGYPNQVLAACQMRPKPCPFAKADHAPVGAAGKGPLKP